MYKKTTPIILKKIFKIYYKSTAIKYQKRVIYNYCKQAYRTQCFLKSLIQSQKFKSKYFLTKTEMIVAKYHRQ